MWKTTVLFGICLAGLFALLKWLEYSYIIKDLKMETYLGIVGGIFTLLGIWIGWKLTHKKKPGSKEFLVLENSVRVSENTGEYDPQNEYQSLQQLIR